MTDLLTLYIPASDMTTCLEQEEIVGKKLYNENKNYKLLANCFEHPEFRKFFDLYFSDESDIKMIIMFMKLYKEIEKKSPVSLNGYQKLSILNKIIKDNNFRSKIYKNLL